MLSAPTRTPPAASSRSIKAASRVAGGSSRLIFDPASVGKPATSNKFLTANGTPASGPMGSPRARVASIASARRNARCSVTAVKELSTGSRSRMRANVASTTPTALARPDPTAAAISAAVAKSKSAAGVSSMKYRCGLGVVGKGESLDHSRMTQNELQIEFHAGLPGWIEFKPEGLPTCGDQRVHDVLFLLLRRLTCGFLCHDAAFACGRNSSAKWQATRRTPNWRSAGIVVLQTSEPRGQRP